MSIGKDGQGKRFRELRKQTIVKATPPMMNLTFLPDPGWNGNTKDVYVRVIYNDGDTLGMNLKPATPLLK